MFIYGLRLKYTIGSISISGRGETSASNLYLIELVEVSTNFAFSNTCIKINQGQKLCSQAVNGGRGGGQSLRTGSDREAQDQGSVGR